MKIALEGSASLLCSALELAVSEYAKYAREARESSYDRIAEQFERQAREAEAILSQAYDALDA